MILILFKAHCSCPALGWDHKTGAVVEMDEAMAARLVHGKLAEYVSAPLPISRLKPVKATVRRRYLK